MKFSPLFIFVFLLAADLFVGVVISEEYLFDSNRPQSKWAFENILWECNFEVDACHFRNQHNLAQFNRYFNTLKPVFGRRGLLLLNLRSPRVQRYPGARLISHYFPSRFRQSCLFISYYTNGDGPQSFYVIQQDKENKCIYADRELQRKTDKWIDIELQLNLEDGDPRFFLETHFQQGRMGYFGVGRFSFGLGLCRNPELVNRC